MNSKSSHGVLTQAEQLGCLALVEPVRDRSLGPEAAHTTHLALHATCVKLACVKDGFVSWQIGRRRLSNIKRLASTRPSFFWRPANGMSVAAF